MAKVDDFEADDLLTDIDIDDDISEPHISGNSSREIRGKTDRCVGEKRLRRELEDVKEL